jgi:hypothetical protein
LAKKGLGPSIADHVVPTTGVNLVHKRGTLQAVSWMLVL